ncbi:tetratricopeptide repeat protein [Flammeovirgaceae bacterium SG7u.111]|nr:tetratricopeptide repeat protein [Flammeovirgaceae bacterium SG7u.132]WPO35189.1 tetratricopeptide repeat protein [Flammeovirgaceae bacterium SG7u.111]
MQIFARAENLRKSNNFIAAIDEYERAIALQPENPRFPFSKGMCYFTLKDYDNAVMAFEETSKLKSDFVPAYTMMAKSYQALERFVKVEESLDLAFKFEMNDKKRMAYKESIIKMLFDQKNFEKALRHINDAKALNPNSLNILYYEASIHNSKGNYEAAKQAMVTATNAIPVKDPKKVARFYYELGYAYNKLGEYEKSSEAFKYANFGPYKSLIAKLSPKFYTTAAICYMRINHFEKSKEMLHTALKMQPNFSQAYVFLSNISKKEANQNVALDELKKAASVESDPKNLANIYKNMAQIQLDNGLYQEAISSAETYLKSEPKNYQVLFIKGIAQYHLKDFKQALVTLDNVANTPGLDVESSSKFYFALGLAYWDVKDFKMAKNCLKRAQYGPYKSVSTMLYEEVETEEKNNTNKKS